MAPALGRSSEHAPVRLGSRSRPRVHWRRATRRLGPQGRHGQFGRRAVL